MVEKFSGMSGLSPDRILWLSFMIKEKLEYLEKLKKWEERGR